MMPEPHSQMAKCLPGLATVFPSNKGSKYKLHSVSTIKSNLIQQTWIYSSLECLMSFLTHDIT